MLGCGAAAIKEDPTLIEHQLKIHPAASKCGKGKSLMSQMASRQEDPDESQSDAKPGLHSQK